MAERAKAGDSVHLLTSPMEPGPGSFVLEIESAGKVREEAEHSLSDPKRSAKELDPADTDLVELKHSFYDVSMVYNKIRKPAQTGNSHNVRAFLKQYARAGSLPRLFTGTTVLHYAASVGDTELVEEFARQMPSSLEQEDDNGDTPLHVAVEYGRREVAETMVKANKHLTESKNKKGSIPIISAVLLQPAEDTKNLVWFLARNTKNPFIRNKDGKGVTEQLTLLGYHDITVYLIQHHSHDPTEMNKDGETLLDFLTFRPGDFKNGTELVFWERWIYKSAEETDAKASSATTTNGSRLDAWKNQAASQCRGRMVWSIAQRIAPGFSNKILAMKERRRWTHQLVDLILRGFKSQDFLNPANPYMANVLHKAASNGIVEIIRECFEHFPSMNLLINDMTPLHAAIANRQEKVFDYLIEKLGGRSRICASKIVQWPPRRRNDEVEPGQVFKYSALHLAALLAPPPRLKVVSGAVLQMQRELKWFQEVEKHVDPIVREEPGKDGMTAREMFTQEHKRLIEKAEEWMRNTSTSCMVVTTLVATVVFTVPGGTDEKNGRPLKIGEPAFRAFLVGDLISLLSSITAILMFLSISNSRFSEEDFVWKLPTKLMMGLAFLFVALASMIVAFVCSLFIVSSREVQWIRILAPVFVIAPVMVFVILHFPMFRQILESTFFSRWFRW